MAIARLRTLLLLVAVGLAGCQRDGPPEPPSTTLPAPAQLPAAPTVVALPPASKDVSEHDPRYMVGISFPPGVQRYPGLALALQRYADAARGDLSDAVAALDQDKPPSPYELSLAFTTLTETAGLVTVAADGSTYTGGAHSNPIVARFVWLPIPGKLLRIDDLIADNAGWQNLSDHVREQLHASLSQRIDADEMEPSDRAEMLKSALKMIDAGSGPDADNFRHFEPVLDAAGKIIALRFVFPPYQVGPYSDGVQSVEVPASVVSPYLKPAYAPLFATG